MQSVSLTPTSYDIVEKENKVQSVSLTPTSPKSDPDIALEGTAVNYAGAEIADCSTLTIDGGATLTNYGTLASNTAGTLTVASSGTLTNSGTLTVNGSAAPRTTAC